MSERESPFDQVGKDGQIHTSKAPQPAANNGHAPEIKAPEVKAKTPKNGTLRAALANMREESPEPTAVN